MALALTAVPAAAHKLDHPKSLRLGIQRAALVVAVSYDVEPGDPSRTLRGLFDRDSDGRLDDAERAKLTKFLEDTATLWLSLEVDGARVALARRQLETASLELPAGSSQSLGISLVYTASVAPGFTRVRLSDHFQDARKTVPVVVDLATGLHLRSASSGEWHPRLRQLHRVELDAGSALALEVRPGAT